MANSPGDIADMIEHLVEQASAEVSPNALYAMGAQAMNLIVLRTKGGRDVDFNAFAPYSKEYQKVRAQLGRSSTVDLAVSGHMQQAIIQTVGRGETELHFMSSNDAAKAAAHNDGVDTTVSVRSHRRSVYVNAKTGQRVSSKEAKLDRRRKNKRVASRFETVDTFNRHQHTPKREWFGVRHPDEVAVLGELAVGDAISRAEKVIK